MNDDTEYQYKYCHCMRHETKHQEKIYPETSLVPGPDGRLYRQITEMRAWVCAECHEEKAE